MQKLLTATALTAILASAATAQEITEFNIGILGGENAQDRLTNQECFRATHRRGAGRPGQALRPGRL